MSALAWTPFTENDWSAFAGAERFADGSDPLIAELMVDGHLAMAIWSQSGVEIVWEVEGDPFNVRAGAHRAVLLTRDTTHRALTLAGFEKDGPIGEGSPCSFTPEDQIINLIGVIGIDGCLEILADACDVEADGYGPTNEWMRVGICLRDLAVRASNLAGARRQP